MDSADLLVLDDFARNNARARLMSADGFRQSFLIPRIFEACLRYLEQDGSPEALARRQAASLAGILGHARTQVPAHRGRPPTSPRAGEELAVALSDLRRWPLLTREQIVCSLADLCDDDVDPDDCVALTTSGTTGTRLRVIADHGHLITAWALRLNHFRSLGVPTHCRVIRPGTWYTAWFEHFAPPYGLASQVEFGMADRAAALPLVSRAVAYAPHIATGLPSALLDFAALLRDAGAQLPVMAVFTYGEQLTAEIRAGIEEGFAAPVFDAYGLIELGPVAHECEHGTYHVQGERCWVEVLGESGQPAPPGETGQIVVTSFTNRAMPLIRYATGDLGSLGANECRCGRPGQVLRVVEGRIPGEIVLRDGGRVNQIALVRILRTADVGRFQIIQEDLDTVRVLATRPAGRALGAPSAGAGGSLEFPGAFAGLAEAALGHRAKVHAEFVDGQDFRRTAAGKVPDFIPLPPGET